MEEKQIFNTSAELNSIDILQNDPDMLICSIDLFHEGVNRNRCDISHECVLASLDTIPNKPITFRYNGNSIDNATDITEHARNAKQLFETRIAGHIPTDSRMSFVERKNGKVYLNVEAVLQKKYLPRLMDILKQDKGKLKVSVEFYAEGHQDDETGNFIIHKFRLQCVTLLSKTVMEGIEGSHLEAKEFTEEEVEQMNSRYFTFSAEKQNDNILIEFQNIKKGETAKVKLTTRQLETKLWDCLKEYTYRDGEWTGKRYWVIDTDTADKVAYIHDNMTDIDYKVPYTVDKNGDVKVDLDKKVEVKQETEWHEKAVKNAFVFAKEEWGEGEAIKVDKSKEAMSETPWGDVNKVDLRNKVLDAENYKELVGDVYLRVEEGWEEAPSEKLGYPIMEIKGGKAVYNRYGLSSALGYAKKENEEEIIGKIMKIYKELGLDEEGKEIENSAETETSTEAEMGTETATEQVETAAAETAEIENSATETAEISNAEEHGCETENAEKAEEVEEDWKGKCEVAENTCKELESRCGELENKCKELSENYDKVFAELKVYKDAEELGKKKKYAKKYASAFDNGENEIIAKKMAEDIPCDEFCKFVDEKLLEKSKKQFECFGDCEEEEEHFECRNSLGAILRNYDTAEKKPTSNNSRTIKEVLEDLDN